MAEIRAFRAFRYDLGRVGNLSDVIAPPYDVIDSTLQDALYRRSPYNVIRLILERELPTDSEHDNRYTRSAKYLHDWQADDVLIQDSARSLYAYHQDFEVEGERHTRQGFLTRVRLEPFGSGRIYPHEQTLAGPKADRLRLFRATAMNLSPVFGLYPDPDGAVTRALESAVGRALALQATDHLGVVSKLWPISDQHAISSVTGLLGPKPVFIADGHHRYETGLRYLEEQRQAGAVRDDEVAANFILMMLVSMSDPGLLILPTHRLVSGLPELRAEQLTEVLSSQFQVERIGTGESGARDAWDLIEADGSQSVLGFGTVADGAWLLARLKSPELMDRLAPDHSPAWRGLAVSILHVLVLDHLLAGKLGSAGQCQYVHLLREVQDSVAGRRCQLAALVPPASMRHVEQIAGNLEKMPPKSTYFYPKLLSGLVFNPLKGS
jgi:uncharacterized protein (DUF1015 family)